MRWLTIPPCEEEHYSTKNCLVWCFFGIPFLIFSFTQNVDVFLFWYLRAGIAASVICFAYIYWKTRGIEDNERPFFGLVVIIEITGCVCGLVWSYLVVSVLIDALSCIGVVF